MFSVDGQDSWNYFKNDWVNHIPKVQTKALYPMLLKFYTETYYIQAVGLSEMASIDQHGNVEDSPVFPFSLRLVPSTRLQWSDDYTVDIIEQLKGIPANMDIWTIYGLDAPEELGGVEHKIGTLVTKSAAVTSNFGDVSMYYRHQRAEDDIKLRPTWEDYYPKFHPLAEHGVYEEGDCGISKDQPMKPTCPFAFLLS